MVDVAADAAGYSGKQHGQLQQHIAAVVDRGRVTLRSRTALERTRVKATLRPGSWATATLILRSRGEDERKGRGKGG